MIKMKKPLQEYRFNFQIQGIIWSVITCVFYKLFLNELAVIARRAGISINVGFLKLIVGMETSAYTVYDYVMLILLASVVLQCVGIILAIKEKRPKNQYSSNE